MPELTSAAVVLPEDEPEFVYLRNAGVAVVLRSRRDTLPSILHWGEDLGELNEVALHSMARALDPPVPYSSPEALVPLTLLPSESDGYTGQPGLIVLVDGASWLPAFEVTRWESGRDAADIAWSILEAVDPITRLALRTELLLDAFGVLHVRHTVTNRGSARAVVQRLAAVLPVPDEVDESLDFAGRWCRERVPQRREISHGTWLRETRHGRPGHDAPTLLIAGTRGFGNRSGSVWGVHLAWSGNACQWLERSSRDPGVLGSGEFLEPGEVSLAEGQSYTSPWTLAAFSADGLDGLSGRLHRMVRAASARASTPRPVSYNTWEAVYFRQSMETLGPLADTAAALGVERFVLDDGWFLNRADDATGVGDWVVDPKRWPHGLSPLIDRVAENGMQFGLWVEPESVNPDSELARDHPEWVSTAREGRPPATWRHEQVLDLTRSEAFDHVLHQLDALLIEYPIAYLKWDFNRDHIAGGRAGRPTASAQTAALYRLLGEISQRHPAVEIESCASGGGRVDLGIAAWADRYWPSDTIDPVERVEIQRWTALLVPPERIGTHLGAATAHTTGRTSSLPFRLAVATFGHFGIEADLEAMSEHDRSLIGRYIDWYKQWRPLIHSGSVFNEDHPDPSLRVSGVVDGQRKEALLGCFQVTASAFELPRRLRLSVLDDSAIYRVSVAQPLAPDAFGFASPAWLRPGSGGEPGETVLSGRALRVAGLQLPVLLPESALMLEVREVDMVPRG